MQAIARIFQRIIGAALPFKSNIMITVLCMVMLTILDIAYSRFLNHGYIFQPSSLLKSGYWATGLAIFLVSFTRAWLFWSFSAAIFALSVAQIINYAYFGSYILPIHFLQLLPDFLLIMSALVEVLDEMSAILAIGATVCFLIFLSLRPLSRSRAVRPRVVILILALFGGDFIGNYAFIVKNREKFGEPSFKNLFPDVNNLGIFNVYKSARFLLVGVLPDRLAGGPNDYPALPEPALIQSPDANIILIINESIRAESLSVLGYDMKTTPRLEEIDALYATQIYSAGTMTRTSFAAIINRLKYPGIGEQFASQSNCLFRLAKQNGFKTHFFYSQGRKAADTLLPYMCSKYIDSTLVDTDAPPEHQDFDESLSYLLQSVDFNDRNLIVIGPKGAHSPYANKSPEKFKKFPDEYDNAVHYADHVVAELIEIVRKRSSKPTFILMTSDHGEILKGEDDKRGHGWFKGRVVKVPFLFLSENDPAEMNTMTEVRKVQSHFDMATLVLALLGYDAKIEDSKDKEIYINGSDLFGLAGQLRLHFVESKLISVNLINSVDGTPTVDEFAIGDRP
jgi:glucan phosphoethanolaminetransferase (alkaline phosphatase superfamily)